jgi:hypothetical protein
LIGYGLTHKYLTRLKRLACDKRSSLFLGSVSGKEKKVFLNILTGSAVDDWHDIKRKNFEQLFGDVIVTHGIFKTEQQNFLLIIVK